MSTDYQPVGTPIDIPQGCQVLAHAIVYDGVTHRMAIARFNDDRTQVDIHPFHQEEPNTIFINGRIAIIPAPHGPLQVVKI